MRLPTASAIFGALALGLAASGANALPATKAADPGVSGSAVEKIAYRCYWHRGHRHCRYYRPSYSYGYGAPYYSYGYGYPYYGYSRPYYGYAPAFSFYVGPRYRHGHRRWGW